MIIIYLYSVISNVCSLDIKRSGCDFDDYNLSETSKRQNYKQDDLLVLFVSFLKALVDQKHTPDLVIGLLTD